MAHHLQLSWLLVAAHGRVCVHVRYLGYQFYYQFSPEIIEILVDAELIMAVNFILLRANDSLLIATNTFMQLLRPLACSAHASLNITTAFWKQPSLTPFTIS